MTATRPQPATTPAGSPFQPVTVTADYPPPAGRVHPDPELGWLRRLAPLVKAHRGLLIGSLILALGAMLIQVALPAVSRAAIDDALTARTARLAPYVAALVVLGLIRAGLTFAFRSGLYRMAFSIESDLRVLLYQHLNRLSFAFYDRTSSGQVISRANSDIRSVQLFLMFAPIITMTGVMFVAAMAFMLSVHVGLTLAAVAPLPLVYLLGKRLRDDVFPLSWINQSRLADVATIVDENINGVRVVRSFAAERRQIDELADAALKVRWAGVRTAAARATYNPLIENLPRLGTLIVLVYGGWLVIEGRISEGTLFAFSAYVLMLQVPFRTLGLFLMMGQRARASAARIFEILDTEPDVVDRPDAVDLLNPRGEVVFDDVHFAYGPDDPPVLRGFSLRIPAGETVAIVGRTGSGKSSIARLLERFYDVDSGAVRLDGHDVRDLTQASLRAAVGLVSDEPFLFSTSLGGNVAYARPDAATETIVAAATAAEADEFIGRLDDGYDTVVGERGYTLSGGQRQRVALARALLADPAVLILDDATSAVDVEVEARIHRAIATAGTAERTTILIAHRLSTIAQADRVVLLDEGRVAATGRHDELLATVPRYVEVLATLEDES
ncbi:MAG: ABC transporter ATP-binding protein [Acidimicrobiales bacterium]